MKYLLLIALLLLYLFGLKRVRPRRSAPPPADQKPHKAGPQQMVSCSECGLHMPADEALPGLGGVFCCAEHRAAYEERRGPY